VLGCFRIRWILVSCVTDDKELAGDVGFIILHIKDIFLG
jgi:hypothetical protein